MHCVIYVISASINTWPTARPQLVAGHGRFIILRLIIIPQWHFTIVKSERFRIQFATSFPRIFTCVHIIILLTTVASIIHQVPE